MAATLGEAILRLIADPTALIEGLKKGTNSLEAFGASVKKIGVAIRTFGTELSFIGAGLTAILAKPTSDAAKFEYQMSVVKAVTNGTAKEMDTLANSAKDLGKTTQFTALEVAFATTELAKAGIGAKDTKELIDALPGTLNLAAAGGLELGESALIAANLLAVFNLKAYEMERVADVLAKTANMTTVDVRQMAESFKYVGSVVAQLGIDIETASAAIGVLAQAGIRGSMAGTSIQALLVEIAKGTSRVRKGFADLGVDVKDIDPVTHDLVTVLTRIRDSGFSAGDALKIFGERAVRAVLPLTENIDLLKQYQNELKKARGSAEEYATVVRDNVVGAFKQFKAALQTLEIGIFETISNRLKILIQTITANIAKVEDWVKANKELSARLVIIVGSLIAFLTVGGLALVLLGTLVASIGNVIKGVAALASWLQLLPGFLVNIYTIGSTALSPLIASLGVLFTLLKTKVIEGFYLGLVGSLNGIKAYYFGWIVQVQSATVALATQLYAVVAGAITTIVTTVMAGLTAMKGGIVSFAANGARGLLALAMAGGPIVAAIVAVVAAITAVISITGNWKTVLTSFLDVVKPGFSALKESFGGLADTFSSLGKHLFGVSSETVTFAELVGVLVGGPLRLLGEVLSIIVDGVNLLVKGLDYLVEKGGDVLAWLTGSKKSQEEAAAAAKLQADYLAELDENQKINVSTDKEYRNALKDRLAVEQGLIDLKLQEKPLSIEDLARKSALLKQHQEYKRSLQDEVTALDKLIREQTLEADQLVRSGQNAHYYLEEIKKLKDIKGQLLSTIDQENNLNSAGLNITNDSIEATDNLRKTLLAEQTDRDNLLEIIKEGIATEKIVAKERKEIAIEMMRSVDAEIAKIKEKTEAYKENYTKAHLGKEAEIGELKTKATKAFEMGNYEEYQAILKNIAKLEKELEDIDKELTEIEVLDSAKRIEAINKAFKTWDDLDSDLTKKLLEHSGDRIALAKYEAEQFIKEETRKLDTAYYLNVLAAEQLRKLQVDKGEDPKVAQDRYDKEIAALDKSRKDAMDKMNKIAGAMVDDEIKKEEQKRKEAKQKQEDLMNEMQGEYIKASGDRIAIAKFEAEEYIRQQKRKAEETFKVTDNMTQAEKDQLNAQKALAIQKAEDVAALKVQTAIQEEATKIQADANKKAGASEKTKQDAAKLVNDTLRQRMQILERLKKMYDDQWAGENRAMLWAKAAQAAQEKVDAAKSRGVTGNALDELELDARLKSAMARKKLLQAGLPAETLDKPATSDEAIAKKFDGLQKLVDQLRMNISDLQKDLYDLGRNAVQWYWDGWKDKWPDFMDWIKASVAKLKFELDSTTRHSPSLVDVMHENVRVVHDGIRRMGESISGFAPNFGGINSISDQLNLMQPIAQPSTAISVAGVQPHTSVLNDNRNLSMQVHSSLDVQELSRHIGNNFRSGRGGGV
jgi:TP901 family phage tail tape measure protein